MVKKKELWRTRTELLEEVRRIVSRFNLLKIKNRGFLMPCLH